jgi:curli production assembly/transport component CsgE
MMRPRCISSRQAWRRLLLLCILCVAGAPSVRAVGDESIDSGTLSDAVPLESGQTDVEQKTGFVVDRTVTNFGAEFFRYFSEAWRDQSGTEDVDVTVVERPSARYGSLVYVEHGSRQVVRVFLYAGRGATIKPSAVEAARYVANQVVENALATLIMSDPDLGKDELK